MRAIASHERDFPPADAWDRFVAQDPNGHLLQTCAWGELKASFGWHATRVAVERDGSLVAGAQVLYRRLGPCTLAYIPKGPVSLEETADVLDTLWQAIHRSSRHARALALKIEPEWRMPDEGRHAWLHSLGFRPSIETIQPRRTIIVDLQASEDDMLARMKPKWRYNIRLSARKGVEVRAESVEALPEFYRLMQITGQRDRFGVHSQDYYRRALELFEPTGRVQLFMAYFQGVALAGLMAFAFNRQAWYMYGASDNSHRELMPNHQLQWHAMQWAKRLGCRHYDLWGIPDSDSESPTADLEGVGRFKSGFGGEVVRYVGAYDHVYMHPLYWLLRQVWARRRSASQDQG